MRVLFLTSEFPYPPFAGAPLRNFGLITGLAAEHEIWLLSFRGDLALPGAHSPLNATCARIATIPRPARSRWDRLRDLAFSASADIARRFTSEEFSAQLREWLAVTQFDLVQIENLEMAIYLPEIKAAQPDVPVIYDAHNAEFALQQRIYETERTSLLHLPGAVYSYIQARRVSVLETAVCRQVDHVIAVSDADAGLLRSLDMTTPVTVVPNGISTDIYQQPASQPIDLQKPALLFTGKMDYRPNVDAALWFAEEILPLIRQDLPDAHFYIVGQSPHPRLDVLRGTAGITLTGLVPEVLPYLQAASVFVVPLRMGSGTRLKVLQAMAVGCPIISTTIGAQGLSITDGEELFLADTAKEFARAVIRLHEQPTQMTAMGEKARAFVREHYDWSVLIPLVQAVYRDLHRA
ncbi:MAG: glycosyltransferase [Anaerolineae bacterium]|nr:glycosyltransferase [Anaerolineae bacterium]